MGMCEERFPDHIRDLFETWQGGILTYSEIQRDEIKEALVKFQTKYTKAACTISRLLSSRFKICVHLIPSKANPDLNLPGREIDLYLVKTG
jgi:hypothetical protein